MTSFSSLLFISFSARARDSRASRETSTEYTVWETAVCIFFLFQSSCNNPDQRNYFSAPNQAPFLSTTVRWGWVGGVSFFVFNDRIPINLSLDMISARKCMHERHYLNTPSYNRRTSFSLAGKRKSDGSGQTTFHFHPRFEYGSCTPTQYVHDTNTNVLPD